MTINDSEKKLAKECFGKLSSLEQLKTGVEVAHIIDWIDFCMDSEDIKWVEKFLYKLTNK